MIIKVDFIGRIFFRFVVINRVGFNESEFIVLNVVDGLYEIFYFGIYVWNNDFLVCFN